MIRTAVILAAGRGSRLDPGGHATEFSKPLVELAGQTLLERATQHCRAAGVERILIVTGFRADRVAADAARYDRGDVEIVFNPDWRRSNGLSLYVCRDRVQESFALLMADHVFDVTILGDLLNRDLRPDSVTLAVDYKIQSVFDLDDATKVWVEPSGHIREIHKQLVRFNAVDCGLFACTPAIFSALGHSMVDGDCSLSDGMGWLARENRFHAFDVGDRWWQDVDTPEMFHAAATHLTSQQAASS